MHDFKTNPALLEERIGYRFNDKELLHSALTHSSYVKGDHRNDPNSVDNERLEFLGDAVLELAVSELIYRAYPRLSEGDMTKMRAAAVCESALFVVAKSYSLDAFIRLSNGEEITGGRNKPSILSDALEALIGAMYLDGGKKAAFDFIAGFIDLQAVLHNAATKDNKTRLQEFVQRKHLGDIAYGMLKAEGPEHKRIFTMAVYINNREMGRGQGHSKQEAAQNAAGEALNKIKLPN